MKMNIKKNNSGIALILVLGILAVLAVLATTFAFNMRLEQKAARNYLDAVSADCIAKLGIEHAIAFLHNDLTGSTAAYDWNGDTWGYLDDGGTTFGAYGGTHHVDMDNYPYTNTPSYTPSDAQWLGVLENGVLVGRYAILVIDEASKMNINMAGNIASGGSHGDNEGWTTFEISIKDFFNELGFSNPDTKAEDLIKYRYGGGASPQPGSSGDDDENNKDILEYDGIDNDGDDPGDGSGIDEFGEGDNEPDEFTPWYPRNGGGDDTAFSTIMEIRFVPGVISVWDSVKNLITVNSRTRNQYWDGSSWENKLNLNAVAEVQDIYYDILPSGDVITNWHQKCCNIMDYRDRNIRISAIKNTDTAEWIYGVEPILINEVLGKSYYKDDSNPPFPYTLNDGEAPPASWNYTCSGLAPNTCYRITINRGVTSSDFDATIGTSTETADRASYNFADPGHGGTAANLANCISNAGGQISIKFEDNNNDTVDSEIVSVEFTCAEFVELCNISSEDISLNGWKIKVENNEKSIPQGKLHNSHDNIDGTADGQTYYIKTGTVVGQEGYFVFTNDEALFDYSYGDKSGTWGDDASEGIPVAVMSADWTNGYATEGELGPSGENIILKDGDDFFTERAVSTDGNSDDYGVDGSTIIGMSREKNDPTVRATWLNSTYAIFKSSAIYKNGVVAPGDNLSDLYVKNYPFASIGEMSDTTKYKGVASGSAWSAISGDDESDDLGKIAERITVDAVRLDAETADTMTTGGAGEWANHATSPVPYLTESCKSSSTDSDTSYWEWEKARLQPVDHILYVYGIYFNDDDYLDVYVGNYTGTTLSFPGTATVSPTEYQPSDGLKVGTVTASNIGSDGRFAIRLVTDSTQDKDVYFDYLLLVPQSTPGKINVNTAALQVLKALPGLNALQAEAIYNTVHDPVIPYDDTPYEKLGDVLNASYGGTDIDAAQFSAISNLISVHSDVFKIICLAQTIQDLSTSHAVDDLDLVVLAEKKVEVIVDRSSLPIRILSWKEITE